MKKNDIASIEIPMSDTNKQQTNLEKRKETNLESAYTTTKDCSSYGKTSLLAWIQIIICLGVNCSCSYTWATAASIPTVASNWMGISLTQLNWISNITALTNAVTSLFTPWLYEKCGIKNTIILAGFINSVGCWIRCIAIFLPLENRYPIFIIGQLVASAGGPLIYNVASRFSSIWFAPQHRGIANNLLATGTGAITAPLLIPALAPTVEDVSKMLVILASISTICTIPTLILPKKPRSPPSPTSDLSRAPFWQGVKQISKDMQFWWIAIIASVFIGIEYAMSAIIIEAIVPYGYSEKEAGVCAAFIIIGGFFGGVMSGYWLRSGQHFMLMRMFAPIAVYSSVALIFQILPNSLVSVAIACTSYGFFARGSLPIFLELASEITYPMPESISASIIFAIATVKMLFFIMIFDALRAGPEANPPHNMKASLVSAAIIMAVGSLPCLWLKGDLKRLKVDNDEKKSDNNE